MSRVGESIIRGLREAVDFMEGRETGAIVHRIAVVPGEIDVKRIREASGLSQVRFAATYGFTVDAVRNWEQGRRKPDLAARTLLTVIEREPEAVLRALAG